MTCSLVGVVAHKEQEQEQPPDQCYIHCISELVDIQLIIPMLSYLAAHTAWASLHDNTYKRTYGNWREWEVVIWDDHLNMHMVCIIFGNLSTHYYVRYHGGPHLLWLWKCWSFWTCLDIVLWSTWRSDRAVTQAPFFPQGRGFHSCCGRWWCRASDWIGKMALQINNLEISGIHETDLEVLVQYIVKTCWTHCSQYFQSILCACTSHWIFLSLRNMDQVGTYFDNPDELRFLWSFECMNTDEEFVEFREFCHTHPIKQFQGVCYSFVNQLLWTTADWYENKICHKWYLGSLNQHLSWIPAKDWPLGPRNTNIGESTHAQSCQCNFCCTSHSRWL